MGLPRLSPAWRRILSHAVLIAWAATLLLSGSYLMGRHLLTLPKPSAADEQLSAALARSLTPEQRGRWLGVHVLYEECGCSQRVLRHLLSRGALPDVIEKIIFIGDDSETEARARSHGFAFEAVTPQTLWARYHIEAAPLLLVADGAGALRYVGGYTDRKKGPNIRDVHMIRDLMANRTVRPLPTFGCAVSESLKNAIDPLNIGSSDPRSR